MCASYFQYSDWIFFWVALRYFLNDVQLVSLWNFLALLYSRCFLFLFFMSLVIQGSEYRLEGYIEGDELVHNFQEAVFEEVPE